MTLTKPARQTEKALERTARWIPDWVAEESHSIFEEDLPSSSDDDYSVVLHDDDEHSCRDYLEVLEHVFGYTAPAAYELTRELGVRGRVIVWTGSRRDAEQKAQSAREYCPKWRRSQAITAPHHVAKHIPPPTITVEMARDALKLEHQS